MAGNEVVVGNGVVSIKPKMDGKAVSDLEKKGQSSGESSGQRFGSAFSVAAGNLISSGIQKIALAATNVFASAFSGFASYEQLTGGVETLFKGSADKVKQYAANAYSTAGMSANQYMEQVTSFSASLLQGLGGDTEAAADYANMAMTDMSDNANKMGTSMELITNAYQGFAKQNYTMLDNLKLGYGGTKSEMERLLKDASAIAEVEFNIDNYQDVIEAIHVMQTEMGISGISAEEAAKLVASGAMTEEEAFEKMGTTAKEATSTIEGSLGMTKAAWSNFLTGLFDEAADLGDLAEKLAISAGYALKNVVPRIGLLVQRAVLQLPEGITAALQLLPTVVGPTLRKVFGEELGMQMTESFKGAIDGFIAGASQMWEGLLGVFDSLKAAVDLVMSTITERIDNGTLDIEGTVGGIMEFMTGSLFPTIQSVIDIVAPVVANVVGLVMDTIPAIQDMISRGMQIVTTVINAAMVLVDRIMSAVWPKIQGVVTKAVDAVKAVTEFTWPIVQNIIMSVMGAVSDFMDNVWPHISDLIDSAMSTIETIISVAWPIIQGVIETVMGAVYGVMNTVWPAIEGIVSFAVDGISGAIRGIESVVAFVQGVFDGIKKAIEDPINAARDAVGWAIDAIKGFFNFEWSLPGLKLPHIIADDFIDIPVIGRIPNPATLRVDWYAEGGIVDGPTLIGAGEAGPEMILPQSGGLMSAFADAVASRGDAALIAWLDRNLGPTIANYTPTISRREFDRMARGAIA